MKMHVFNNNRKFLLHEDVYNYYSDVKEVKSEDILKPIEYNSTEEFIDRMKQRIMKVYNVQYKNIHTEIIRYESVDEAIHFRFRTNLDGTELEDKNLFNNSPCIMYSVCIQLNKDISI